MKYQLGSISEKWGLFSLCGENFLCFKNSNWCMYCLCVFRDVEIGDVVTVGECRPLSKTVRFNVLKVTKGTGSKKAFKKFQNETLKICKFSFFFFSFHFVHRCDNNC